jgi:hypothetical protein
MREWIAKKGKGYSGRELNFCNLWFSKEFLSDIQ